MTPTPWPQAKRDRIKAGIDAEAAKAARRLGASGVIIIAVFKEGEHHHAQDGGTLIPMTYAELYRMMLSAHAAMEQSGGKDVSIQ